MLINADFSIPVTVDYRQAAWEASPMAGVERLMLDRVGGEVARATSIVRYAPGSRFSEHVHDEGEEFFVLEGVFSDDTGDFPSGTYVRNPPFSAHAPWSDEGCTIFVKLRQFDPADRRRVVCNTSNAEWRESTDGVRRLDLHRFGNEVVELAELPAGLTYTPASDSDGTEFLILDGVVEALGEILGRWSWLRVPPEREFDLRALERARLFCKRGHFVPSGLG